MTSEETGRSEVSGRIRHMSIDMDVFFTGIRFFLVTDGDDVDEERNEHTDQGVEDTVEGEVRDAGIGTVCDGDTQKCDTGDVGQGAFPHEVGQKDQGRDRKEFSQVAFFFKTVKSGFFLTASAIYISGRIQNDISRYCSIGNWKMLNSRMMNRTAMPVGYIVQVAVKGMGFRHAGQVVSETGDRIAAGKGTGG